MANTIPKEVKKMSSRARRILAGEGSAFRFAVFARVNSLFPLASLSLQDVAEKETQI
jgi:hypothetical protein